MTEEDYKSALEKFMVEEFLEGTAEQSLTETTPLVTSGILDSLRIAMLLSFIRDSLGVFVPFEKIDMRNFSDIRTIAAMLDGIAVVGAGDGGNG
jgi:acyl carrier protein